MFTINYGNWNNIAWSSSIENESFVRLSPHRERDVTLRYRAPSKHPVSLFEPSSIPELGNEKIDSHIVNVAFQLHVFIDLFSDTLLFFI